MSANQFEIQGLDKNAGLPYATLETDATSLPRNFEPVRLDPQSWVGVADLEVTAVLSSSLGIKHPTASISAAQHEVLQKLYHTFHDTMVIVDANDIRRGIQTLKSHLIGDNPRIIPVTFDQIYAPVDPSINVTRIVGRNGEIIGQGPRPNHPPLAEQIESIRARFPKAEEVLLIDDVLFSGQTTGSVADAFANYNLPVRRIIIGVAKQDSIEYLKRRGIETLPLVIAPKPIDIVDIKDLVGATPLSGRVFGRQNGDGAEPHLDGNGIAFRVPYTKPDGDPVTWATIPPASVREISVAGWGTSQTIFTALEQVLGKPIVLGDLSLVPHSTGFPGGPPKHMENNLLNPNFPIQAILYHKLQKAKRSK